MAKEAWIMLPRWLLSPEHIEKIGPSIWLYLYAVDHADWKTGEVHGWVDGDVAEQLGIPARTVRHQRQNLERWDYIVCRKHPHTMTVKILNWVNPSKWTPDGITNDVRDNVRDNVPDNVPIHGLVEHHLYPSDQVSRDQEKTVGIANGDESASRTAFDEPESDPIFEPEQPEMSDDGADLIKAGFLDLLGAGGCLYRGEGRAARIIAAQWTPDQLSEAYGYYKAQPFWAGKRLGLAKLGELLPEYFAAKKRGTLRPASKVNGRPTQSNALAALELARQMRQRSISDADRSVADLISAKGLLGLH